MNIFLSTESDVAKDIYTVYKHTFPNNKIYIGITSVDVKKRWANGRGYKDRNLVGKAINKYGWENVKHEILFENLSKEKAELKEIELIKKYKSNNRHFGYNVQNGGNSRGKLSQNEIERIRKRAIGNQIWLGKHHTEETKQKLREIHTGMKMSKESIEKRVQKMRGRKLSESHRIALLMANIGKPCSKEKAEKISLSNKDRNPVTMFDLNQKPVKTFHSILRASKETGVDNSSISRCCKGLQKTAGGYYWKYCDNNIKKTTTRPSKAVCQFDRDNNLIKTYNSVASACIENKNFTETPIRYCCNNRAKTAYGYVWKYKEDL